MASQGITFAALLLALAALAHAADTTNKNDLYFDSDSDYSVIVGYECLFLIGALLLGLLFLLPFLGTSANVAQLYDFAPFTSYSTSGRAYDEMTTFSVKQFIEDAVNKFQ